MPIGKENVCMCAFNPKDYQLDGVFLLENLISDTAKFNKNFNKLNFEIRKFKDNAELHYISWVIE